MGRWTQYDEDEYRLPEGMKRVGYDSDSGRYIFKDQDGSLWQGAEGAEFSEMTKISDGPSGVQGNEDADEDDLYPPQSTRRDDYMPLATNSNAPRVYDNRTAYRTLFPFFLVIFSILLFGYKFFLAPVMKPSPDPCPSPDTSAYLVEPGDSCWEIGQRNGCSIDDIVDINPGLKCERLMPGMLICLPQSEESDEERTVI